MKRCLTRPFIVLRPEKVESKSATAAVNDMTFILFSVAGLAFIRFIGSAIYMIVRLFAGE